MNLSKKKQNIVYISVLLLCVIIFVCQVVLFPAIHQKQCQTRLYADLENKLDDNVCSSNVRIIKKTTKSSDSIVERSYGEVGCGVIFAQKNGSYYVLTAAHVVDGDKTITNTQLDGIIDESYYIVPYGTITYKEASRNFGDANDRYLSAQEYYSQFEKADVDFISESCDIAIIRFESKKDFYCLKLAQKEVSFGDRLVSFGRPVISASNISYGSVISKGYKTFDSNDGRNPDQTLFHNAYVLKGSSGGAVLNEDLEIAGINIGAGTDVFDRFKFGAMIPSNLIVRVLQEWNQK